MKRIFLPDINFWLALVFDNHDHHQIALNWANASDDQAFAFCRLTQQGLLRLATNRTVMGKHVLTMSQTWTVYDEFTSDARVTYLLEPADIESQWRRLTQSTRASTHLWNDAYLAAFANAGGYEIVTFDRGFAQFNLSQCTILR